MTSKTNITKKDIVEQIAAQTGRTQIETKIILESFLDALMDGLTQGNNVEIRGFGRFKLKMRKKRTARNPRTGETVTIKAGTRPVFEPSRELIKSLNPTFTAIEEPISVKNNG